MSENIVGVDEAGVGALMGIMTASAVFLPYGHKLEGLKDSKQISEKKRFKIAEEIHGRALVGIGVLTNEEVDFYGMARCRRIIFHRALDDLLQKNPDLKIDKIIVDGTLFEDYNNIKHECIPKADTLFDCVSAASIIAKTFRDEHVLKLCDEDKETAAIYQWKSNKGYPSKHHMKAIKEHGVTKWHRKSYKPCQV
jgi:ribonuclease HII